MTRSQDREDAPRSRTGIRLGIGLGLSAAIVGAQWLNLDMKGGAFFSLEPDKFGQVLAGVAAALGFVWLVVGYLQQSEELRLQRWETARLANEARRQATAIEETTAANRRDLFMKLLTIIERQQCDLARRIIVGAFRYPLIELDKLGTDEPTRVLSYISEKLVSFTKFTLPLGNYSMITVVGDHARFTRAKQPDRAIRTATLEFIHFELPECRQYQANIATLLAEARKADETGAMVTFLESSAMMRIHRTLSQWQDTTLAVPDQPTLDF